MNISLYTVCFNEELILPHFLNYYSRFANRIVIWDNKSTDRSLEIARAYSGVEICSFDTQGQYSELTLMAIRYRCWKGDQADFVIVCDADEFLYCDDLPRFLEQRPDYDIFRPVGFNMIAAEFPANYERLITEQVKFGARDPNYSKMVLFRPTQVLEMNYGPGSHTASPVGVAPLRIYDAAEHGDDLKLLHYKNLGFDHRADSHSRIARRLHDAEFAKYKFGLHYLWDEQKQRHEFEDIKSRAIQVIN